jgi:hypothetical protein
MTREKMKQFANSFCCAACGMLNMIDCDSHEKSCQELANYLYSIKDLD